MLRKAGLVILARNWRAAGGELDLAALEGKTLVFVEVKARAASAESTAMRPLVTRAQKRRMGTAVRAFRRRFGVTDLPFRFDLVTVRGDPRRPTEVTWLRNFHSVQEQA